MPYWRLFYHIVWSTKNREPLLTPTVESIIYGFLRSKATGLGAQVFALNGTLDHVHIVVSIPPKIAVAKFVGQIKAVASTRFNKSSPKTPFFWQREYGVFSFDAKRLPNFVAYVEQQKEHHAQNALIPILERVEDATPYAFHEDTVVYAVQNEDWRRAMEALGDELAELQNSAR